MKHPSENQTHEVLAGLVERVTYHNVENGFCVVRAKARGHRDVVTVVGHAASIAAGERITASGEWINDRTHGQQFKARFLRISPPTSADGIEKYLSSGMIRGIGPAYAKKLLRAFGDKVFAIIEATPDRLREVDGIGPVRASRITCCLGPAEGCAGNHGVSAQPRCRHGAGSAYLQGVKIGLEDNRVEPRVAALSACATVTVFRPELTEAAGTRRALQPSALSECRKINSRWGIPPT
jgi:ATP-dependent exoDNAse (exonuclease V) alpha subunit